jgi:hypothetical protein
MKEKTASIVIPSRRNGREMSQTTGNKMSASTARGQQSTNRMHQPINKSRAFMLIRFFHFCDQRQLGFPVRSSVKNLLGNGTSNVTRNCHSSSLRDEQWQIPGIGLESPRRSASPLPSSFGQSFHFCAEDLDGFFDLAVVAGEEIFGGVVNEDVGLDAVVFQAVTFGGEDADAGGANGGTVEQAE